MQHEFVQGVNRINCVVCSSISIVIVMMMMIMMIMMMVWRQNQIGFDQNENSRACLQYAQLLKNITVTPHAINYCKVLQYHTINY